MSWETPRLLLNDGSGSFSVSTSLSQYTYQSDMELGDLDGDGDLDLVMAHTSHGPGPCCDSCAGCIDIMLNNGSGFFNLTNSFEKGQTFSVALGDVDADGDLDLITANYGCSGSGVNSLYRNDGSGGFTADPSFPAGCTSTSVSLGDLDGDGDLDAVFANGPNVPTVLLNNGTGGFTVDTSFSLGDENTRAIAIGDVNADGHLDILFGTSDTAKNTLLLNNGGGGFVNDYWFPQDESSAYSVAFGDVDGGTFDLRSNL